MLQYNNEKQFPDSMYGMYALCIVPVITKVLYLMLYGGNFCTSDIPTKVTPLNLEMTFLHDTPFLTHHSSSIPDVSDESGILGALFQEGSGTLHTCHVDTWHRRTFLYVTLSDHTRQALSVKRK